MTHTLPQDVDVGKNGRREQSRQTLRYIMLGLLGVRPMTGYDIKSTFDRSVACYWNASHSQIYGTLRTLETEGLVESEIVYQESRPNRRVYQLTERGDEDLQRWLHEAVPARFTKDEFLAKLFFCGESEDGMALAHLEDHRRAVNAELDHLAHARERYAQRSVKRPRLLEFQLLVLEYKEALLRTDLQVTQDAIAKLRSRDAPSPQIPDASTLNLEH